ncbi:hypothetical protein SDC9_113699 [bioreactor metagenome]|uniref:Signal peptidase II n=1 Tax=bioreactor metagenome TaxID=1076179 RepID=A0A645BNU4_9ZZZZ
MLLAAFLWANRRLKLPCALFGVGSLCNYIVIAANGFAMPVSSGALARLSPQGAAALLAGEIPMYRAADAATRFLFLGDVIWFPVPFFRGFASLGDLLLCAGAFFLLMTLMAPNRLLPRLKSKESAPTA